MSQEKKNRISAGLKTAARLIGIGILYLLFVKSTGRSIPCIFHFLTGYNCPGCGITRAFTALAAGDPETARQANLFLWYTSPVITGYGLYRFYKSVWKNDDAFSASEIVFLTFFLIMTVTWGIYRNIHCI